VPLFSGYLFGVADRQQRMFLEQNRMVANILLAVDQDGLVRQLLQVDLALQSGEAIDVLPYLEEGSLVKISSGPFRGMEGVIERIKGKSRVILNVDMIGQAIAVEVDSTYLLPS
jgi:transcription antitermination factor NusG